MSEYHSFSLAEHLPPSKSLKKNNILHQDQQQAPNFDLQPSNNNNASVVNDNDNWANQTQHAFQNLDSILSMSNYNHTRHHSLPESTSDYNHLFEFLPFHDTSSTTTTSILDGHTTNLNENNNSNTGFNVRFYTHYTSIAF